VVFGDNQRSLYSSRHPDFGLHRCPSTVIGAIF
jgi:hypothetical protein